MPSSGSWGLGGRHFGGFSAKGLWGSGVAARDGARGAGQRARPRLRVGGSLARPRRGCRLDGDLGAVSVPPANGLALTQGPFPGLLMGSWVGVCECGPGAAPADQLSV